MPAGVAPQIDVNGLLSAMALKSQIDKTNAETRNIDAQRETQTTINGIKLIELGYARESIETDISLKYAEIASKNSNVDLNTQNILKSQQEVTNLISSNEEIKAKIELLATQRI